MRVCILTKSLPFAWVHHYVKAFRQCCDEVLVVGPTITVEELRELDVEKLAGRVEPTDIETELTVETDLIKVLPQGWTPDLIVAISIGGVPICPIFRGLYCPKVYLSVDTWQSPRDYFDAIYYDVVFAVQREYVARLRALGARHAEWLPLACDPDEHAPYDVEKTADITYAGSIVLPIHQERYDLVKFLQSRFRVSAVTHVYGAAFAAMCCSGKLTFNHSAVRDLNMRVFEALAMGCPLLTNRDSEPNGLLTLFEEDKHLIVYDNQDDLVKNAERYLADDALRNRVARAGRTEVLARHTYRHRVETLIHRVRQLCPEECAAAPHADIVDVLPRGVGAILDLGASLDGLVPVLKAHGVPEIIPAVDFDSGGHSIDAIVIYDLARLSRPLGMAIDWAWDTLPDAGILIIRLSSEAARTIGLGASVEDIRLWFLNRRFMFRTGVVVQHAAGSDLILTAIKRTKSLLEVIEETFRDLPATCEMVKQAELKWAATLPEGS